MREAAAQGNVDLEKEMSAALGDEEVRTAGQDLVSDPALDGYWPSEKQAIVEYCDLLSCELHRHVKVVETVQMWESGAATIWRREKMRVDGQRQLEEIARHKFLVSQQLGYDIGWEHAARDWIERYAAEWRKWWEHQPESCPYPWRGKPPHEPR